jgi:hypothetical protein
MWMRRQVWLGYGLLLLLLATGCAATADPSPAVPVVTNGRDARHVEPCRLLTETQVAALRLGPGVGGRAPEGPHCEWRDAGSTLLSLTLYTHGAGLTTLARNSEPTTRRVRVSGYPALETFTGRGEFCQYDVGIADTQVMMIAMDTPGADSCSKLQTVIPMIAGNLPAMDRS